MDIVQDHRLLLAILAPLIGAGAIMATGRRPNVREAVSFIAAVAMFGIVVSLVPLVQAGKTVHFTVFQLLPGFGTNLGPLSFSLRAEGLVPVHHLFRHVIIENKSPFSVRQVVRETYVSCFIRVLKTGFQITGGSTVHGFRVSGFWVLVKGLL